MKKHITFLLALSLLTVPVVAQPSDTHYSSLNGLSSKALFDAVHSAACQGYKSLGYDGLFTAYPQTDSKDGKIWDMYSNCDFAYTNKCGNFSVECDCYNREHSIPKSWWGGSTANQGCDIFHLLPTDGKVNGMRSNYPYGEVANATYTSKNGSKLGSSSLSGYSGRVFEPIDEYKGDIARGILGAMTKWKGSWTQGNGSSTFNGIYEEANNFGLTAYGVALLLKWHREDPVSQKERDRNNGIQNTQGNRNPFIDYPCLVEYLWGTHKGETFYLSQVLSAYDSSFDTTDPTGCSCSTEPRILQPTQGVLYDMGSVQIGNTTTKTFTVKGANLTNGLTLTLSGTNSNCFTISPSTITAAQAINGQPVAVIYNPAEEGTHTAQLNIASAECTTVTITLSAKCVSGTIDPDDPDTPTGDGDYVKVTKALDDYSGTYLIVYEDGNVCFNAAGNVTATGNKLDVTITDNTILATTEIDAAAVRILPTSTAYAIQLPNAQYIGSNATKGNLTLYSAEQPQNISVLNGTATIKAANNTVLRYNSDVKCFRYYQSGQQSISLFRKSTSTATDEQVKTDLLVHYSVQNGILRVTTEQPAQILLYDVMGRLIDLQPQATLYEKNLPQGFYLLRVNDHTERVLVP